MQRWLQDREGFLARGGVKSVNQISYCRYVFIHIFMHIAEGGNDENDFEYR